ncbi:MAG: hypothetical protein CVV61_04245 [Tenericutes bacterium HGW-Tenericutes-6]|jgi:hypothetical protein|nr:MAG: hypothetical protein CVV62_02005 [Tenericutes bacterium HGW-Tenericutes-7]PKK93523.1 MAG: hypothetical protein CVV61_04245 [Tenericutes bacterium HGW-Tenericutes-6]
MDRNFHRTTVSFTTLCYAMGQTLDEAKKHIQDFANQENLSINEFYSFIMSVSKGKEKNHLFILYGVVPENTKGNKTVQIVKLKHQNFISFNLSQEEYLSFGEGTINDEFDAFFKHEKIKWDMSFVYALIKEHDNHYQVLMPYRDE